MTTYRRGDDPDGGDADRDYALTDEECAALGLLTKPSMPTCQSCGAVLSAVTFQCVRGAHCQPARVAQARR